MWVFDFYNHHFKIFSNCFSSIDANFINKSKLTLEFSSARIDASIKKAILKILYFYFFKFRNCIFRRFWVMFQGVLFTSGRWQFWYQEDYEVSHNIDNQNKLYNSTSPMRVSAPSTTTATTSAGRDRRRRWTPRGNCKEMHKLWIFRAKNPRKIVIYARLWTFKFEIKRSQSKFARAIIITRL